MDDYDEVQFVRLPGMIPFFPDIMDDLNTTIHNLTSVLEGEVCMCSDLQTEDYSPLYAWYNYILIIICLPPLSAFGVCTNIVNVYIYSRKRLQNSANTYLLFLACSDFLVILTGLFIFWIDSARSYIPELARAPYTTVYTLPFGYMAQTCSIYFTVAAAFDCYINVCWKQLAKSYCTIRRAKQICFTTVFISILYNSLRFPQFNLRKCFHEASQEQIIEICPTSLFFTINTTYNVYMYMVLMTLLPFLFLLCLNAIILFRQSLDTKTLKDSTPSSAVAKSPTSGATSGDDTITMIMVVILFLACNTLALVVNMIETFTIPDPLVLNLLSDASNFLVVFNSSVNCIIYLVFNKEYREVFLHHAALVMASIRKEYCSCCNKRRDRHGLYQPVRTRIIGKDSRISDEYSTIVENGGRQSPVWQPLSQRHLPNIDWSHGCFNPTNHICLADDDSGWDEGASSHISSRAGFPTRWIAEVNILDGQPCGTRPQIVVKPIGSIGVHDNISITAL